MSRNTVDAAIEVAHAYRERIMLIPSRRQIETAELGGGYVEGWTTEQFAEYVRAADPERMVLLCRDHGGPWQSPAETGLGEREAMRSCMLSFRRDIEAGFDLLHIDTSSGPGRGTPPVESAVDRLLELYAECCAVAAANGREVQFEVGVEEQGTDTNEPAEFARTAGRIIRAIEANGLPRPAFVVAQTGSKVIETGNAGALEAAPNAVAHTVRTLAAHCRGWGTNLKAHNMDYLQDAAVRRLMSAGVAAINVAPEFGVAETKALLRTLTQLDMVPERDKFVQLACESGAWRKWLKPNSQATDIDRAVISGHYVFGTADCREIKARADHRCRTAGKPLDDILRAAVRTSIERFLHITNAREQV
ncbi:MAG: class II D-tagatose-bisphosphate aldolase, non-catalytic subunit [Kibdelosporangium sp.]